MATSRLQLHVGVAAEPWRHACQLNYYFCCGMSLMCPVNIVCMSPRNWPQHFLSLSCSDTWPSVRWCKATVKHEQGCLFPLVPCASPNVTEMHQLPPAAHATWDKAFLFDEMFFCFFSLHVSSCCLHLIPHIQISVAGLKRDKPNICDHPNITLCSKNTCRSGSEDSPRAPTCGPGLSRSAVTPVPSACFSLSRPSVTTHTNPHCSVPLLSVRNYNDTFILTLAETFPCSPSHVCILVNEL